jgi:Plasmid recombination enzyme/Protein of unknown function (DUF3991)
MPYAIARIKKLKKADIAGSESHTARKKETPNADSSKQNIRLIGSTDPEKTLEQLVDAFIGQHKQKRQIRTDAVYAVEILLTASPQYYRPDDPTQAGYYEQERLDKWAEANIKWLQETYGDRIVRAELHLDEATPHLHAYLVPLDEKGQLRCNHFFDGRKKMQAFQDNYHNAMSELELERGIKGSVAKHQDIKDFYSIVESGRSLVANKLSKEQLIAKAADRDRATKRKSEMEATAKKLALENEQLKLQVQQLQLQVDQLRDLPLHSVAWQLGLIQAKGNDKCLGENHVINIDNSKWYDFHPSQNFGGGGAIDLVMHVNQCNFKQAVAWLSDRFGEEGATRAGRSYGEQQAGKAIETEPTPQFEPPQPNDDNWALVHNYLTQKRGLRSDLVELLYKGGRVYADSNQNAVFVMKNLDSETSGAFLRGTKGENNDFMGYARGTKRDKGWFYVKYWGQPTDDIQRVVVCKSPIEALSIVQLDIDRTDKPHEKTPPRTLYLAADSPRSLPLEYLQSVQSVIIACGKDDSELVRAFQELLPSSLSARPKQKDWNLELLERLRNKQAENKQQSKGIEL